MPSCPPNSDRVFAVRVDPECRVFDFTLLFEDIIFSVVPASLFLFLVTPQILIWRRQTIKLSSYRLTIVKSVTLFFLLVLNIVFLIFRLRNDALFTEISLASSILDVIAIGAAIVFSFLSDQRAVSPSHLLTLYFSLGSILSIPRLRSLWLIHSDTTCRSLWTAIFIFTTLAAFAESATKESMLLPEVRNKASKEELHGIWGRSLFFWINSVLRDGYRVTLQVDDLPDIDENLCIPIAGQKIQNAWDHEQDTDVPKKNRLLRATFQAYLSSCLSAIPPRLILIAFKFCQPFLITATVNYVSSSPNSKSSPHYFGQGLIGAYILENFGMAIATSIYWRQAFRFVTMIRAGLVSMIHEKLMRSRTVDVKESEAITHMEVDVDRIVKNLHTFHETWACLIEIIIAVWLLERQLGATCVVPALISVLSVVASIPVAKRFKNSQKLWVQRIGRRVIVTAGVLRNIKVVKMLGLNKVVYDLVQGLREVELQTSHRFRKLLIWTISLSNIPADLAPFATFLVYALVAIVNGNDSLLSARAFTSLSLISLLTSPLLTLIQICPGLFQSVACFDRIEEFYIQSFPQVDSEGKHNIDKMILQTPKEKIDDDMVVLNNASFAWDSGSDPVLQNIDLVIERQSISILTGLTGAGKSALLESIMGETTLLEGTLWINPTGIAYCPQESWILNDTIRNNIIGGTEIDEKWYDFTLKVCCLKSDLERIPHGDMFKCGSGGVALSGGQKQRIALARAVYSKSDVILCDDIFSGLDSKTLGLVSKQLLGSNGYFREAGKSVIITTQNPCLFRFADKIFSLEDKRLTIQTPSCQEVYIDEPESLEEEPLATILKGNSSPESTSDIEDVISMSKKDDQSRRKGGSGIYRFYLQRSGVGLVVCFIGAMILESACANVSSVWIQEWSSADEKKQKSDIGMYLGVYAAFLIASSCGLTAGCWIINRTAIRMHSDLLKTVLGAPFHLLYSTDLGSLVNRFSEDMTLIDMNLPADAINAVGSAASCVTKVVIICIFGTYFTASMPVFLLALCLIQIYYLRTSRQIRLLDIETKSLLVSHFLEAIQGVTTLRALGWGSYFQRTFESHFRHSQRPFYMLYCIQQWLTLVLDLVSGSMAVVLVAITVSLRGSFSGGSVGVALYMIMTFNQSLTQLIDTWISLETSIGAVFRVKTFMQDTPSESQAVLDTNSLAAPLPSFSKGGIKIINLTASYGPSTAPILKGLSLDISSGEKIAVCGKSGSGKTSLILALLQMMEIQQGTIEIDGINLEGLEPDSIRSSMSIVSQDQFFLPGPVRLNLNPHNVASDEIIEQSLKLVGLWDRISSGGGLEMELKSSEWSVGEKQLLALARAMTIQSHVLILDEATGSVDLETEELMQKVITEQFKPHTVISVLHRYTHIRQFDRVVVIENGIIIEDGSPETLLGKETEFRKLYGLVQQSKST
ncbi:multidrug resistance-associated protein [Penicillium malachiteum]|uniref:multidrug resistance-associated protein n=1 Tax=Penicillium malachiteum TaxID=1324776 RepID=UPI002546931F|nr:multidrug resistance-associated protein [Penicillium malachiteum]KAJ5725037.1 multidrug resistance-associated protein [Penicillium malachiteum]